MTSLVSCDTHGLQKRTRVCRHIVDTLVDREPRGMHWTSDNDEEPCAWCTNCHSAYRKAGNEWTNDVMVMVDEQVLCFSCFKLAQQINGFGVH